MDTKNIVKYIFYPPTTSMIEWYGKVDYYDNNGNKMTYLLNDDTSYATLYKVFPILNTVKECFFKQNRVIVKYDFSDKIIFWENEKWKVSNNCIEKVIV